MAESLYVLGPGRAGLALAYALWQCDGVRELTLCGRRPDPPSHPLVTQGIAAYHPQVTAPPPGTTVVLLSVPDRALAEVAGRLAEYGSAPPGCAAFHLSGALGADVLAPLHECGYHVGTLHPLQSLASPITGADRLPGSTFALSGEPGAIRVAHRLLAPLRGRPVIVPVGRRPLYHAAAVMASNHLATVIAVGARLLARSGVPPDEAVDALLPLARGTLDNIAEMGIERALTGPVARGDTETVLLHLRSLEPREREVYRALARELAELARSWGFLDEAGGRHLIELLEERE